MGSTEFTSAKDVAKCKRMQTCNLPCIDRNRSPNLFSLPSTLCRRGAGAARPAEQHWRVQLLPQRGGAGEGCVRGRLGVTGLGGRYPASRRPSAR